MTVKNSLDMAGFEPTTFGLQVKCSTTDHTYQCYRLVMRNSTSPPTREMARPMARPRVMKAAHFYWPPTVPMTHNKYIPPSSCAPDNELVIEYCYSNISEALRIWKFQSGEIKLFTHQQTSIIEQFAYNWKHVFAFYFNCFLRDNSNEIPSHVFMEK